jgi:biofilm protein TabA
MRQVAVVPDPTGEVRRLMVYDAGNDGVYLFLFRSLDDGPGFADYWFESVADAVGCASLEYGVDASDWQPVPDPEPGCQHDWVAPVRVSRDAAGQPLLGRFERLHEENAE